MDRKHPSDFPQELLNLFDLYVHGEISRRDFFNRAQKFAVGGRTAAGLFALAVQPMALGRATGRSFDCLH